MPKVSVVSTVYNGANHFDQIRDSILSQDYDDFEWVILDDQSTDETPALLSDLADGSERVRVITPDERLGRARSLNRAIEAADGTYIAQQDFDDLSAPDRLQKQADYLEDHPQVGVVGAYYERIDDVRGESYVRQPPTEHADLVRAMAKYIPFAHTLVTFRKAAWREAGGYPLEDDLEDIGLWIRMAASGWKLGTVPENLGTHFVYEESTWHRRFDYAHRQRRLARIHFRAVRELGLPRWMYLFPLGRLVYPHLPTTVKRIVRRTVGGVSEQSR